MPRPTGNISAEIVLIESRLATGSAGDVGGMSVQMSSGNTSLSFADRQKLEQRLDQLYRQLDRLAAGTMISRGRLVGLPGGSVSTNSP